MDMFLSDSDYESFSESSGSEDQDDIDSIYGEQAQSLLSSLEKSIGKIDGFLSFERGFVHGNIVYSITDPSGQMGRVENVHLIVDLETVYGEIIKNVNTEKLKKIRSFSVGDYVVHGPWVGRVTRVVDRVTILFDDGAKCEILCVDPESLLPISPNLLEHAMYPYYPGQRIRVRLSNAFKSARWLCGEWKENRHEGSVCCVEAGLVYVDWVASPRLGYNPSLSIPPPIHDSKNLTLLPSFPHASWQLGDWCLLRIDELMGIEDQVFMNASTRGLSKEHKNLEREAHGEYPNCIFNEVFMIVKMMTKVDVLWQDGSRSIGLDSQSLFLVNTVGDHEFWPEQFVLEKGTCNDQNILSGQRLGIVKSVDARERTVTVKWKTSTLNPMNGLSSEYSEETVSAYELIEHQDYSYDLGGIVFRLERDPDMAQDVEKKTHEDFADADISMASINLFGEDVLKKKHISEDYDKYPDKCFLSCIGIVTGFKDGAIEVRWANGVISKVEPYEIVGIDINEDSPATPVVNEEDIEHHLSPEMPEYGKQSLYPKEKDALEKDFNGEGENQWKSSAFSLPRAAIGFFKNIATSFFGCQSSTSLLDSISSQFLEDANKYGCLGNKEVMECCSMTTMVPPSVVQELQNFKDAGLKQKVEDTQMIKEHPLSSGSKKPGQFKQFDIVTDCSDHFVNGSGKGLMLSQMKRNWFKKVQKEWSILEKDLPDTIYVRVYEERIDLLRAAIVGAPGTPYHDGLFFFDFFLPPDYPHEPPLVHYNSGGLRINPNLYESGKICLSLLNTWTGTGSEVWNSGSSTILQVLLSLQALVLNDKPYFNEAGYDQQMGKAEGEKNSITYNENTFILSIKSMLFLLHKPPKHFEALVEEHFKLRAHSILAACKAYMGGVPVGFKTVEEEMQKSSSKGFQIMLTKLVPKLLSGFIDKGIDCSQFT